MVYDDELLCELRDIRCRKMSEIVYVADNNKSVRAKHVHRRYLIRKHSFIARKRRNVTHRVSDIFVIDVRYYVYGNAAVNGEARHSNAGADRVKVGVSVSHNNDVSGVTDMTHKLACDNARTHLRALLRRFCASAEEFGSALGAKDDLVSSALKRGVECGKGCALTFPKSSLVLRDTDRNGDGRKALSDSDRADLIEHIESAEGELVYITLLEEENVFVQKPWIMVLLLK